MSELTAQSRVLNTPELLEAILLQLPTRDLLFAQLVSHTFQTLIRTSPSIQQALFFRPAPPNSPNSRTWTQNPLLREAFTPWFTEIEASRWDMLAHKSLMELPWIRWAHGKPNPRLASFLRPEASWRRMLLVQPPPTELLIEMSVESMGGPSKGKAQLSFDKEEREVKAVTMGAVYDITISHLQNYVSWFSMSFKSEGEEGPPLVTLHLGYVVQCTGKMNEGARFLQSEANDEFNARDIERQLVWDDGENEQGSW